MGAYRLYFVAPNGRRLGAFDFTSADDSCAEIAAQEFRCGFDAELWCGGRQIGGWRQEDSHLKPHHAATARTDGSITPHTP